MLRAILKAADLCAADPALVARRLVDNKFTDRYDYALQALGEVPYRKWRDYDAEDAMRFYALRLHEAGTIKSIPQNIIADGTDWRFINELKRELKMIKNYERKHSMQNVQNRRRFLTGLTATGAMGLIGSPTPAQCRTAAGDDFRPLANVSQDFRLSGAGIHFRRAAARRGFHRRPVRDGGHRPAIPRTGSPMAKSTSTGTSLRHLSAQIQGGVPIKVLAGMHAGCLELIANDSIRSIADLKGRRVGIDISRRTRINC